MTPRIYDIGIDDFRQVTAADVKRYGVLLSAWGRMVEAGTLPADEHERVRREIAEIDAPKAASVVTDCLPFDLSDLK